MDKKKLLITASTFPRWKNDTEPRFILDYAKAMTKYFEVHVLAPMSPGAKEEEQMEGVEIHRFHYFPIHKFETLCYPGAIVPRIRNKKIRIVLVPFLLLSMLRACKLYSANVDLVHAHWLIPQGLVQSKIKKTPYIVTGHGGDVTSLNMWPINRMKRNTLSKAYATIGVSNYICKKMQELCPGINPQMISMGCDLTKFSPEKCNEKYFNHDKKNIIFVGRLAEKKGVRYLIDAMKEIDANLFIIGSGPLEETLKEQVLNLGLQNKISFWGAKSHEELPEILASADLFVAPSIVATDGDQEGLPVSIMEAMASGLPVVSGISGGTKDIVKNGVNGFIIDVHDIKKLSECINIIINDGNCAERMKKAAIQTASLYSYDAIAVEYLKCMPD